VDKLVERYAKVQPRQRYAAVGAVLVLLVVGYWQLYYGERDTQITNLEKQYSELEKDRASKQAIVENLARYEARLNELQQRLNEARALLPDDADVPQLLAQLDNRARQAGLAIDKFQPKGETQKDFYAEIAFEMNVRGSYHEVATFIDSVGKLDRIVNVQGINMLTPRTENQKVVLASNFFIKTYRFVEGKKPAAPGKAKPAKGGH
jgi:type IV pilus assembly protein PilO